MKAGTYFIGDPCYVINDDDWNSYIDLAIHEGQFEFKGYQAWSYSTAYGDGVYYDQNGNEFPVDSGMIGVTPIEVCDQVEVNDALKNQLGVIIAPKEDFSVNRSDKGTFFIENIVIDTGDMIDEEDWLPEDEDEDDDDDVMFSKIHRKW